MELKKPINISSIITLRSRIAKYDHTISIYEGSTYYRELYESAKTKKAKALEQMQNKIRKVRDLITIVEGRSTVRRIDVSDIIGACNYIEAQLPCKGKALEGVVATVNPNHQKFSRRYKWTPHSTLFTLQRTNGKWYLTSIERGVIWSAHSGGDIYMFLDLPEDTKKAIVDKFKRF